jgi:histidyl-tRNA synthetase
MIDLLGSGAAAWERAQTVAREVFARYGYAPIYTPLVEYTEVFARGIGEATDVVGKEMYSFEDRGGRGLSLRPENTAGVVRAAIDAHLTDNGGGAKLYYAGPMFRYERPQKGRQRQFYQIGAEALGFAAPMADAEMILMLWDFFCTLGLPAERMRLLLNSMGDGDCRPAWRDEVAAFIRNHAHELCEDCVRRADTNPLRAFDCKNESCRAVFEGAPPLTGALCDDCARHFAQVRALLDAAGLDYVLDPTLVRGLDYYTRTVFEIQVDDGLGSQNAIGGGGRYDGLFEQLGGRPTPGIGFAIGFERSLLAMEAAGVDAPGEGTATVYVAVAGTGAGLREAAFALVTRLRAAGIAAVTDLTNRSLKAQFKQADRAGARFVAVMGDDEQARGGVTLRNMDSKREEFVLADDIVSALFALSPDLSAQAKNPTR